MSPLRLFLAALLLAVSGSAFAVDLVRRSGDVLSYALPGGTLAAELARGDEEGARQMAATFVASVAATAVLKRTLGVTRPDGSDDLSFPSGHATRAFSAAAYVHRRHGADDAWPFYAAALWVGYTRVASNRHRWVDVAGAAAVSMLMAHALAKPRRADAPATLQAAPPAPPLLAFSAAW